MSPSELFRKEAIEASLGADVRGGILETTSPRLTALWLGLMALLVAAAVAGFVVRVEQRSSGEGALVPLPGDAVLRAPSAARTHSVEVALGEEVHRGDVIAVLADDSLERARDEADARLASAVAALAQYEARGDVGSDAWAGLERLTLELRAARDAIDARLRSLELRAPVDGVVVRLEASEGGWLEPGAPVCALRPMAARLVGRLDLPARDLPRLVVGSEVRLKFEAWQYQDAGVGVGRITHIGEPLGESGERRTTAPVLIEIISLPHGATAPLRAGMGFVGDVSIGEIRLIGVLFQAAGA